MEDTRFGFPKADTYAFIFDNAHLLLMTFERDDAKFLFLIKGQDESGLILDYPGRLYTDTVLDAIENIFFIQVQAEENAEGTRYVLGSVFQSGGRKYGAYYERDTEQPDVVLFRIVGEAPNCDLAVLEEGEYVEASAAFMEQHQELMDIRQV